MDMSTPHSSIGHFVGVCLNAVPGEVFCMPKIKYVATFASLIDEREGKREEVKRIYREREG